MSLPQAEDGPGSNSPRPPAENSSSSLASRANLVATILTAIVAFAALVLSVFNYWDANGEPGVTMTLPSMVRLVSVANSAEKQTNFIIQPTFTLSKASTRTAIVKAIALQVQPPPDYRGPTIAPIPLYYEQPQPSGDFAYQGDLAPVVVAQSTSASPAIAFDLRQLTISPGQWGFVLTATLSNGTVLEPGVSCLSISHSSAKGLVKMNLQYKFYRDFTPADTGGDKLNPECYRG